MTVAAVAADIAPPRPAWRNLLWTVPVTALWTLVIYWQPRSRQAACRSWLSG
jgi:hypothetical protein